MTEEGAFFRSHIDGAAIALTPEEAIRIQEAIGADIAMQLDHVVALPNDRATVADAMRRSLRWAERCLAARRRPEQAVFGIVQGGLDPDLRRESAARARGARLPGLCRRRALGRRGAGGDAGGARRDDALAAGRPAPLPDGRRASRRTS